MTDNAEETNNAITAAAAAEEQPPHQEEEEPKPSTMADTEELPPPPQTQDEIKKPETKPSPNISSFSIWPPTQRTRDAVVSRLVESLSTPSVLSKRYGPMPADEASGAARRIEDEAFAAAAASASTADDSGIEVLQVYSKEISKRMLDAVKSRSAAAPAAAAAQSPDVGPAPTASGEISSVENES